MNDTGANLRGFAWCDRKIHHEVFLTFLAGVTAEQGVLSEMSPLLTILAVCAVAGIGWLSFPLNGFGQLLQPIHVVRTATP